MDSCSFCSLFPYQTGKTDNQRSLSHTLIRSAEAKDLKKLAQVLTVSFHPSLGIFAWIYPLLNLGVYEDLRSRLRSCSPHYKCLVACREMITPTGDREEILGVVEVSLRSFWALTTPIPYISNLAVSPNHRREGIGGKLLLKCEQIALEWGFDEISLHVLEDNQPAKQLYLNSGYRLDRIDFSFSSWLFKRPRRLFLHKKLKTIDC